MSGNEPSNTFGPVEDADATRQSQHAVANDTPVDVNFNAVLARQQAQTTALAGSEFEAAAARRTAAADSASERRMILADQAIKGA